MPEVSPIGPGYHFGWWRAELVAPENKGSFIECADLVQKNAKRLSGCSGIGFSSGCLVHELVQQRRVEDKLIETFFTVGEVLFQFLHFL